MSGVNDPLLLGSENAFGQIFSFSGSRGSVGIARNPQKFGLCHQPSTAAQWQSNLISDDADGGSRSRVCAR